MGSHGSGYLCDRCDQYSTYSGLLAGNLHQFEVQLVAICASVLYAFIVTFILAKAVDVTIGLRVKEEEEYVGLDISQHGERA